MYSTNRNCREAGCQQLLGVSSYSQQPWQYRKLVKIRSYMHVALICLLSGLICISSKLSTTPQIRQYSCQSTTDMPYRLWPLSLYCCHGSLCEQYSIGQIFLKQTYQFFYLLIRPHSSEVLIFLVLSSA